MQSLLRTRPENLDDLTIQVALVRPGPIQGGAVHPFIDNRQQLRREPGVRAALRPPAAGGAAARDARGRSSSRIRCSRSRSRSPASRRRGGGAAAGDEPQAQQGGGRGVPRALRRGRARARGRPADGGGGLREAERVRGLRLPEVACGGVRAARVPVGVAAAPLSGRVPVRAPERAADGLLPALVARARRAAARGGGAPSRREPQRAPSARWRARRCGSAWSTCARWARRRRRRSWPSGSGAARSAG